MIGRTTKPNLHPMLRGSNEVPRKRPSAPIVTHARGTKQQAIHQCIVMFASTPPACTTEAIGKTSAAQISRPCIEPGEHLCDRRNEPDRARRLDAVFDFTGEAELLRHGEGDRLHALEHDRDPDNARHENRCKS